MRRFSLAVAVAAGILLAPTLDAATIVPIDYEDDTGGFYQIVKNDFSYDFTFVLDEAGYITASLTSSAVLNSIDFTSVTLDGISLIKNSDNSYSLSSPLQVDAGTQTFHVEGIASIAATTFSGTVQYVESVPEPLTWTMMIGGFGLIGGEMRRRRGLRLAQA